MDQTIARRDFLQGAAIGVTVGALAPELAEAAPAEREAQNAPGYYPPTRLGMRGSHPGSFEAAHEVRDNDFWKSATSLVDTGESYDLVVAGAGNSVFRCGQNDWMPTGNLSSVDSPTITNVTPSYGNSVVKGMTITDVTHPGNLAAGTTVGGVSNTTITLSPAATNSTTATGDLFDIVPSASQGNGWYTNVRAEADGAVFTGPLLPDYDFEGAGGCHDTFFSKIVGVNAAIVNAASDALSDGRHWDNLHIFNTNYPDIGAAMYGFESYGHDYVGFPQIDDGRFGAIHIGPVHGGNRVGTRIYGTYMNCSINAVPVRPAAVVVTTGDLSAGSTSVTSVASTTGVNVGDPISSPFLQVDTLVAAVSSGTITLSKAALQTQNTAQLTISDGYQGIEIYPGSQDVTVAATASNPQCNMAANQIVTQDGLPGIAADPSTQILAPSYGSYSTVFGTQANAMAQVVTTNASTFTMSTTQYHICVSPPSTGTSVTLPPMQTTGTIYSVGVIYSVDNCTNNAYTIKISPTSGNGNIDNASTYTFSTAYGSWSGYYTGTNWKTTAHQ